MTSGQFRVLALLLAALGIEALFSAPFRAAISDLGKGNVSSAVSSVASGGTVAAAGAYALALLAIVAFAAPAPDAATWIAILILVYALLAHGGQIVPFVATVRGGLSSLKTGVTSTSGASTTTTPAPTAPATNGAGTAGGF